MFNLCGMVTPDTVYLTDTSMKILTPYVCGNPDFSSRAGKLFENFFHDLLRRRVQKQILIRQQISIFSWDIHDTYSVLVIDMKGQQQDRLQFVITYLCNLEDDCQAFEYDGYTVCIFHAVTADSKSRFSARVEKLLKNMSLKGAFSKNFTNICDVDIYYMQASNIIQFSRRNNVGRNLLFQEHVGLYGIVDASLERHDASELCHPDTIRLYEYDRQINWRSPDAASILAGRFIYLVKIINLWMRRRLAWS